MNIHYSIFSQIEIVNCTFEIRCEVITKNIDGLGKSISEVPSMHGDEFESCWYQQRSSQYTIKKERRVNVIIGEEFI